MALHCSFVLNGKTSSALHCPGLGYLPAFSGMGRWRNDPKGIGVAKLGPLPVGRYYIVDRHSGGRLGPLRDFFQNNFSSVDRSRWFALYRDDGMIDDQTFVNYVRRGEFRIHPIGPMGISEGCITLLQLADFERLASKLRAGPTISIPRGGRAYGLVDVR